MSYLYVMRAGDSGPYKVGITKGSPEARRKVIQTGCPYPVEIVAAFECARPREIEAELHARFARSNTSGEWFDLAPLQLAAVLDAAERYATENPAKAKAAGATPRAEGGAEPAPVAEGNPPEAPQREPPQGEAWDTAADIVCASRDGECVWIREATIAMDGASMHFDVVGAFPVGGGPVHDGLARVPLEEVWRLHRRTLWLVGYPDGPLAPSGIVEAEPLFRQQGNRYRLRPAPRTVTGEGLYLFLLHGRLVWRQTRFTAEGLEIGNGDVVETFGGPWCPYLGVFRAERVWG